MRQTNMIRKRSRYLLLNENNPLYPYLYLLPFGFFFIIFLVWPVLQGFYISFTDWDILGSKNFIGLANYKELLTKDDLFWQTCKNTSLYITLGVPLFIILPLFVALILKEDVKGVRVYRGVYASPLVIAISATSIIWLWILNPTYGILNYYLYRLGLPKQQWLRLPGWAMLAIVIVAAWGSGWNMILFLAGLKEIPRQLYEAADIDGAGRWAKFTRITFPSLRPVLLFVSVMTIVGAFKVFGLILVLTNGGPANTTRSVIMYLYDNAFRYFRMGYASAIAWILFAVILFFTYIQFKVLKGGKAY